MSNNENQKPDDLNENVKGEQVDQDIEQTSSIESEIEPNKQGNDATIKAVNEQPNFAKKTLNESMSRFGSTGQIRAAIFAGVGFIALATGAAFWAFSGEEEVTQAGNVVMPTTTATAEATVTSEQAAYIKAQQEKQAEEAAMRGDTYIAAILTEREQNTEVSGNPTQPGLTGKLASESHVETPNGTMSASQIEFMQKRGYDKEPMNNARNDVPRNLYGQPVNSTANTGNTAGSGATKDQPPNNFYQVQPYQAKEGDSTSGGDLDRENNDLKKASEEVSQWQADYTELRKKKAKTIDDKTQLAFETQVANLAAPSKGVRKPDAKNSTYQTLHFKTNSNGVQYDALGNPISGAAGVSFNATAPQTADINGNGHVNGSSSIDSEAEKKLVVRAGETARAILTSGVNTDEGREVTAKIQTGPLKGATILGTVQITGENIQFRFNRLFRKGKDEIGIDAMARQLGTNKSGMADDIKKHYVQRYSSLAVSSALSGYGKAYEQTAGTDATVSSSGNVITQSTEPSDDRIIGNMVGELGEEISDEIKKSANRKPTYITNSGKVFNLFFNQNVYENSVSSKVSTNVNVTR